jgi:carbohydrate-selective porin OprB
MHTYDGDTGFFFQHDEHIYLHPADADDPRGLNVIARFSWAQADRTDLSRFLDLSIAWHGIGARHDDTVGIGGGSFSVAEPVGGTLAPGDEVFVEAFYKMRLTSFISLQPDFEFYQHPGGDGANAYLAACRLKLKL